MFLRKKTNELYPVIKANSSCLIFFFLFFFRATAAAYESSQARCWIGASAAGLHQSHSNARSQLHLQPIPQLTATPVTERGQGLNPRPYGYLLGLLSLNPSGNANVPFSLVLKFIMMVNLILLRYLGFFFFSWKQVVKTLHCVHINQLKNHLLWTFYGYNFNIYLQLEIWKMGNKTMKKTITTDNLCIQQ